MRLFGLDIGLARKSAGISLDDLIRRLEAANATVSGISVTPENAMESPTVHAIVTAVSRRIATLPLQVMQKTVSDGRTAKEPLPSHPVAKLLDRPNAWQTKVDFWLDATSWLVRYGRFFAYKARGSTGPILRLEPILPADMRIEQDDSLNLTFIATRDGGREVSYQLSQLMYVRGPARDGLRGNSPVMDMREAIAVEIAAERMGATVFGNGAMPGLIFKYAQGTNGHRTDEERKQFVDDFERAYGSRGRFKALLLPKGIELDDPVGVDNEKAQYLDTRKYQRTVIAGAFGVPPHLVGDLEHGTYNNVEQQSLEFVQSVVLPYVRIFEAAMERDLLTQDDRNAGVIIRFNLDGALRGDFKSRQEGMQIQRQNGVLNANEWREREGMNPIPAKDGGDEYWRQGPSGQSAGTGKPAGDPPAADQQQGRPAGNGGT